MDIQYYGGNCFVLTNKNSRVVVDDNLSELGLKSVTKPSDIVLFTGQSRGSNVEVKLSISGPGEYEVSDLSITGVAARAHIDEEGSLNSTMYKLVVGEVTYLFVGHIYPELSDEQLEAIGLVDVMFVPVGGNGYTLDSVGAMHIVKQVEPKLVVPSHYSGKGINYPVPQQSLDDAMKNLSLELRETVTKLRLKPTELGTDVSQLIVLERS